MVMDETMKFDVEKEQNAKAKEILKEVYASIKRKRI